MVKPTLSLLQIFVVANAVLAKSVNFNEDPIYIGNFDENNYYISANTGSWSSAERDCSHHFGNSGHLLAIETEAEWQFLVLALERFGTATTFWTSGMFDSSTQVWRWTNNNLAFGEFAPWGPGFPSTPNQLLRVLLHYTSRFDARWHTVPNTQLHRYICELQ